MSVNENSVYIGKNYNHCRQPHYITPDKQSFYINEYDYVFASVCLGKTVRFSLSGIGTPNIYDNQVLTTGKYKNISSYFYNKIDTRIKSVNRINFSINETEFFTKGKFGSQRIFFPNEPIIEFVFLSTLCIVNHKLNDHIKLCSESLFEHLFKEYE